MAEIQDNGGGKKGKGSKQKKMTVRVDFTPMVDMNMLLITFFMLCTSLSKPQTMEISMPSQALTLLLDANNKLYYYEGEPNYEDYTSLKETDYTADGIRKVLLRKNYDAVKKVEELKVKKANLEITEEEYKKQVSEVKSAKNTPTVIIKATDKSTYKNLIDALDEMQICSIGKYVIVDITDGDQFLIDNYNSKGQLSSNAVS